MDHDGAVFLVVGAGVVEVEAFGEVEVHLHGAELPFALEDVAHDEVDFGAVEGGFAGLFGVGDAEGGGGGAAGGFGFVPVGGAAGVFGGVGVAQADADAVVAQAKGGEDGAHEVKAAVDFGGELFFGAEEVAVVLGEAAHAGHAAEFAGLFPAVNGAEFVEAHGEVAVGAGLGGVDFDVVGAIHGFEQEAAEGAVF